MLKELALSRSKSHLRDNAINLCPFNSTHCHVIPTKWRVLFCDVTSQGSFIGVRELLSSRPAAVDAAVLSLQGVMHLTMQKKRINLCHHVNDYNITSTRQGCSQFACPATSTLIEQRHKLPEEPRATATSKGQFRCSGLKPSSSKL